MAELQYDVVIRNGRIVDGTRAPSFIGDVAVSGGKVVSIGKVPGRGREEVDATGKIVAPGFIDIHTHYDAQVQWDPYCSQSCWHGITTVIMSLCGFGFAPCRPDDRERVMRRMTRVEAIPYEAMKLSMRWDWVGQDDYMTSLERSGLGVNAAFYIPHSAIRAYVMGTDDRRKDLQGDELEQLKELVRDGYRAGALGLSTDFSLIDRDADGGLLPSASADMSEIEELLKIGREFNVGSVEVTPEDISLGEPEIELLQRFSDLSGRPAIHTALFHSNHKPEAFREALHRLEEANARGYRVYALGGIVRIGSLFNLIEYNLFDDMPAWAEALACPVEQKLENLENPDIRQKLQHDLDNYLVRVWSGRWDKIKVFESDQEKYVGRWLDEIAASECKTPLDAFLDIAVAEGLKTFFYIADLTSDDEDANAEVAKHPFVVPGVSDGGAHTRFLSMGKYPTIMLAEMVRDHKVMSLEEAHWRLSAFAAHATGIDNLGTLQPGMPADIVVYDLEKLVISTPEPVGEEIVGGGLRLVERSVGFRAIFVNGVMTFENDICTGKLPGRVIRTSAYDPDYQPSTYQVAAE
ncbi:N-acyl-D-amino-acid deacylase family protein [Novosphingobium lentum]|uniref:N-acyl-D-amino-acid deacylase family protein n=1 Tax=Novosphingobium lentum TaxID=145287 RepID=UPI000AEEAADF|nr:amidohydrolase family protein [Novosphingobium lentum]